MSDGTVHALRALVDSLTSGKAGSAAAADAEPAQVRPAAIAAPLSPEARAALQQALRLLSVRGYATASLRRRLLRHHAPDAVEAALEALATSPFLDDRAWAAAYVAGARGRERSSALLRRELAARGVSREDAGPALAAHDDGEAALAAARRRARALARLDPALRERRLRDYLLRRGFSTAAVVRALQSVLPGADS